MESLVKMWDLLLHLAIKVAVHIGPASVLLHPAVKTVAVLHPKVKVKVKKVKVKVRVKAKGVKVAEPSSIPLLLFAHIIRLSGTATQLVV